MEIFSFLLPSARSKSFGLFFCGLLLPRFDGFVVPAATTTSNCAVETQHRSGQSARITWTQHVCQMPARRYTRVSRFSELLDVNRNRFSRGYISKQQQQTTKINQMFLKGMIQKWIFQPHTHRHCYNVKKRINQLLFIIRVYLKNIIR